jgi:hypothetical protein
MDAKKEKQFTICSSPLCGLSQLDALKSDISDLTIFRVSREVVSLKFCNVIDESWNR